MVYFIGDVHSEFEELARRLAVRKIENSNLVQVGDFGVGFQNKIIEEQKLHRLNLSLKSSNNFLYVIRGNHDDPDYFANAYSSGNIKLLPDYSVLELDGLRILLAGGSVSIDRRYREEGNNYWKEEIFIYDDNILMASLSNIDNLDIVVTHSAPKEFWPYDLGQLVRNYIGSDSELFTDLNNDREQHSLLLKSLVKKFQPKTWYYGHFHAIADGEYSGIQYFALGEMHIHQHGVQQ